MTISTINSIFFLLILTGCNKTNHTMQKNDPNMGNNDHDASFNADSTLDLEDQSLDYYLNNTTDIDQSKNYSLNLQDFDAGTSISNADDIGIGKWFSDVNSAIEEMSKNGNYANDEMRNIVNAKDALSDIISRINVKVVDADDKIECLDILRKQAQTEDTEDKNKEWIQEFDNLNAMFLNIEGPLNDEFKANIAQCTRLIKGNKLNVKCDRNAMQFLNLIHTIKEWERNLIEGLNEVITIELPRYTCLYLRKSNNPSLEHSTSISHQLEKGLQTLQEMRESHQSQIIQGMAEHRDITAACYSLMQHFMSNREEDQTMNARLDTIECHLKTTSDYVYALKSKAKQKLKAGAAGAVIGGTFMGPTGIVPGATLGMVAEKIARPFLSSKKTKK